MANKFVAKRSDISGSGAVNGDVIYLTDQDEVYDVTNSRLTLVGNNCIKISSGVWAIRNAEKTLSNSLVKPAAYDATKKVAAGTVVYKDTNLYVSNGDIPANTTWATGTTGATWKSLGVSNNVAGWFGVGNPSSTSGQNGGQRTLTQTDGFKAPFAGRISKVKFKTFTGQLTLRVAVFSSSTAKGTTPVIRASTSMDGFTLGSAGVYEHAFGSALDVSAGEYIGFSAFFKNSSSKWEQAVPYFNADSDGITYWQKNTASTSTPNNGVGGTLNSGNTTGWVPSFQYYLTPIV